MIPGVDGFMYPKSEVGNDIYFFDKLLETLEFKKGIPVGTFKIIPLIETGGAVLNVQDICKASSRVVAMLLVVKILLRTSREFMMLMRRLCLLHVLLLQWALALVG